MPEALGNTDVGAIMKWNPSFIKTVSQALGKKLTFKDITKTDVQEAMKQHKSVIEAIQRSPFGAIVLGWAHEKKSDRVGVSGISEKGHGVYGESKSAFAGFFEGNVHISGKIDCADCCAAGADCAENFEVTASEAIDPGTVMVFGEDGRLHPCAEAYDGRAAGVISGAGEYKPGLLLDSGRRGGNSLPLALAGKVYCKVDADVAAIQVGDLLTTAPTAGHAMKVEKREQALGAIIGKALQPLGQGKGLIPILVALQ
ncbi:hypothetical protein [Nitratireductor sp. ZSWI3]|uniref:hypothetical protein n=1 Tax=Nitratireductor sp. ZSWI3 TaxID=2966359 RepID=UPI00214FFDB9|nr:hypothetical protein [Nitratireductor sp. ZSWI3]MCR4267430.1 hypothetical protein [Nitratireductor sp. ZSWI3]